MSNVAVLPIVADRYQPCVRTIRLVGFDATGLVMRAQVRLAGDTPGAPLVDLQMVTNGNAEGLRVVSVDRSGPIVVSTIELVINETTMEALPYAGEIGAATPLAWDWQAVVSGRKRRIAKGGFYVLGDGVTGADDAPYGRPAGYGFAGTPAGMTSGATLTFGDDVVTITIDGAELLAGMVASAEDAADRAEAALQQIEDFTKGDPGGDASQVGTFNAARTMTFAAPILRIRTTGRIKDGDGGGALYDRSAATLPADGENVWWFNANGSRWVISPDQTHLAPMFGAMGGAAIDAGPILTKALAAPMVQRLHLVALTHYFSGSIIKPSGKALVGFSKSLSWLKAIPIVLGSQTQPRQAVYTIDDVNGRFADFSLDCQRSGEGGALSQRCSGVTIRAQNGAGWGTVVDNVDVYNATGYAHYDSADAGRSLRGIVRRNCRALNSQVGFETTGNSQVFTPDCETDVRTQVWDGGSLIPCEAMFHEYGAIYEVYRLRCRGIGQAGAGAHPITTDADIRRVIYEDCDIETTNAVPAMIAVGQSGYAIRELLLINNRFVSANAGGAGFINAQVTIRGGTYIGGASAANGKGNGAGLDVSLGCFVDVYGADITGNADPAGTGAAYGLNQQAGVVRVHSGGRITANGPDGLRNPIGGSVTMVTTPILTPASASSGSALPTYRQRIRGEKARTAWQSYNPTATNKNLYVNVALPTAVADRKLTDVVLSLRGADGNTSFPAGVTLTWNWQSDALIQAQIGGLDDLTGFALVYSVVEWTA